MSGRPPADRRTGDPPGDRTGDRGGDAPADEWLTTPAGPSFEGDPDAGGQRQPSPDPGSDAQPVTGLPPLAIPVARRRTDRLALGVLLLAAAVVLLVYGLVVAFGAGRGGGPGSAPPASPPPASRAPAALARFDLPRGWEDRTKDLADDVSGTRADFVFLGPASNGFRSNLNVVRQPAGTDTPPLDDLVDIVTAKVETELSAKVVARPSPLSLGGAPAFAYDYRYRAGGHALQGRQIVAKHGDVVVFVNFTADRQAFKRHAEALDVLTESWRWG